ncbi:MAG TPA: DUF2269 domain-containing protein [Burkholderiaceae bacterium]|jgi:uncharacterized membrane protein
MNTYLIFKWLHILSATVLFGTGIGIAFFKWTIDRSGNINAIRLVNERTVLADWLFTTPAVIAQPVSGVALVYMGGYPLGTSWLVLAALFYILAGCCWLPVVWLQLQMRTMARQADAENANLPQRYWQYTRIWFWLGVPAFSALVAVYWLMVFKPAL